MYIINYRKVFNRFSLLVISILFFQTVSFAQGNGSDGARTISSLYYTDSVRTYVDTTSNSAQAQLKVASTTGFSTGQTVLVIQMKGTGAGQYEEKQIQSVNGGRLVFTSNLIYTYTNNSTSKAQVIKINQYTNVTINSGGEVTAHSWNDTTGGVVYFKANGTVTVNSGGKIDVTAKGFLGGASGVGGYSGGYGCYGAGGSSGSVSGKSGGGCSGGQCSGACGNGSGGIGGWGGTGGVGGNGGDPWSNYGTGAIGDTGTGNGGGYYDTTLVSHIAATNASNASNWGLTSGTSLFFGGGGEGGRGGDGSQAGGGGGGGGRGSGNGSIGSVGAAGTIGASGGDGGIGGGILIIQAHTITGAGEIKANGGNGSNGQMGAPGGNGGTGGNAGAGTAGGGGGGRGGHGANGSCGGGGGAGGTICIIASSNSFSGTQLKSGGSSGTQGNGGSGGNGGTGGNGSGSSGQKGRGGDGGNGGSGPTGGGAGTAGADGTSGANNGYAAAVNGNTGSTDNTNCGIANGGNGLGQVCGFANAGADDTTCYGVGIQLSASGGTSYSWSPSGVLDNATIANPTATLTITTTFTVTASASGCPATTDIVTIVVKPLPNANAGNDVAICIGDSINLTATGGGTYSWNTGATTATINVKPTVSTTYTVSVTNDCGTTVDSVRVTINPLPVITVTPGSQFESFGQSITLVASATNTSSFSWSPNIYLNTTTGATVIATPTNLITYTITGTNSNGCVGTIIYPMLPSGCSNHPKTVIKKLFK